MTCSPAATIIAKTGHPNQTSWLAGERRAFAPPYRARNQSARPTVNADSARTCGRRRGEGLPWHAPHAACERLLFNCSGSGSTAHVRELRRCPIVERHQLAIGGTVLGGDRGAGLSQTVRGAMGQAGFVASIPEPIAEAIGCERLAELSDEIGHIASRTLGNDVRQDGKDGLLGYFVPKVPRLTRDHLEPAILDHLAAKSDQVVASH